MPTTKHSKENQNTMNTINSSWGGGARPEQYSEAGAVDWRINPKPADTPTAVAHHAIKAVVSEHGKYLQRINPMRDQFSEGGFRKQVEAFGETEAARALDLAEQVAVNRTAQAQAAYANTLHSLSPKLDMAGELRGQRALQRAERAIEAAEPGAVGATVQRLIADADPEARGVLLAELPDIVQSKGVSGEVVERAAVDAVPELKAAADTLTRARQSESIIRYDVGRVRQGIVQGHTPYAPLVDPSAYDPDNK